MTFAGAPAYIGTLFPKKCLNSLANAGWRRSADRACLHAKSLLTGNFTGNFATSGLLQAVPEQETAVLQHILQQFPKQINRENFSRNREFIDRTGNFICNIQHRKRPIR